MPRRQCTTHHISPQTVYNTPYLPTDGVQHTISPHRWCTAHHTQISPQMVYSTPYPNLPSDGVQHTILKSPLRWCTAHHTQISPQMVYSTPYSNLPSDGAVTTVPRSYVFRSTFRICPSFSSMSLTFYDLPSKSHANDFTCLRF